MRELSETCTKDSNDATAARVDNVVQRRVPQPGTAALSGAVERTKMWSFDRCRRGDGTDQEQAQR